MVTTEKDQDRLRMSVLKTKRTIFSRCIIHDETPLSKVLLFNWEDYTAILINVVGSKPQAYMTRLQQRTAVCTDEY